jgi:ABC-2 type transport system ATP-binding protein
MRQRLGIARALVNEPQVVFLDEPTLGLDPAGQRQILRTVRRIAEERGATILLSTHLLAEVEETCSRVLILNRGRVAAHGTVAEVAAKAAAPRTGRLAVPPGQADAALRALAAVTVVEASADGRPGLIAVRLTSGDSMNDAVRAVLDAGVTLLSSELEGARLSDAFLAMTEAA